jgi:peptide/nickel transport system substrate-binding protein
MILKRGHLILGFLLFLSLTMISCSTEKTTTTTKPSGTTTTTPAVTQTTKAVDKPQYGGSLRVAWVADFNSFDDIVSVAFGPTQPQRLIYDALWQGDWTKGDAGGYGTGESPWLDWYDKFEDKAPQAATSWKWTLDAPNDKGTLVYQIRPGVHFAVNRDSEASRLVAGREMTADDVVFSLRQVTTDNRSYLWRAYKELRDADIQKTGTWEVTIKVPFGSMIAAVAKFGSYVEVVPQEVVKKYGNMGDWRNTVGTGSFILKDYVTGGVMTLEKNDNYWDTDPIGPGKGNKLPYIDSFKYLIIPDASTRLSAFRTGKIDQMPNLNFDDAATIRSSAQGVKEREGILGGDPWWIFMNTQKAPFDNVKVRRALFMATDLEAIKRDINHGLGQILTWPVEYQPAYKDIYLGLDDPEMPASVKELYTYDPVKAKQVLADAGYPNGFKTTALIDQSEADYFSVIKDMWSKIGVDLSLNVQEAGARTALYRAANYEVTGISGGRGPLSVFYKMVTMVAHSPAGGSGSNINDPVLDAASAKMMSEYLVDPKAAMATFKESMKYTLDQAYVISRPMYPLTTFWWPWLKNYTGEYSVGYVGYESWARWVWIDQSLKKTMGY